MSPWQKFRAMVNAARMRFDPETAADPFWWHVRAIWWGECERCVAEFGGKR